MIRLVLVGLMAALCLAQARGMWEVSAREQTSEGRVYHLRGDAVLRGEDMTLRALEIDFDEVSKTAHLKGNAVIETATGTVRGQDLTVTLK